MTPAELSRTIDNLITWESLVPHMYADTRGFVTVGIGHMLKDAAAARALPFRRNDTGAMALPDDVERAWQSVHGMLPGRLPAYYVTPRNDVRLLEDDAKSIAAERLVKEFEPALVRLFAGFDGYPDSVKLALFDVAWNLGTAGISRFGNLIACCRDRDWKDAALECHVSTSRADRNAWRAAMFRAAADEAGMVVG